MNDALFISAIGMGLVFAGILLLWGLMALLVHLTTPRKRRASEETITDIAEIEDDDLECKRKAAAAAVVATIALLNTSFTLSPHQDRETISPWQAVHRSQRMQSAKIISHKKGS